MRYLLASALCVATALVGCGTVPPLTQIDATSLQTNPALNTPDALRVDDILDLFGCDIQKSLDTLSKQYPSGSLSPKNYVVKILLTVEVDDDYSVMPSLTWQNPLGKAMTSFSAVASGNLDFQRQKFFTATYNLDTATLRAKVDVNKVPTERPVCPVTGFNRGLYSLTSDLDMKKIILAGLHSNQKALAQGALNVVGGANSTAPTFGAQVKFVVTKAVTGLGPVWSLRYFKGPSAATGLLAGKGVDTDTVIFAFSEEPTATVAVVDPSIVAMQKSVDEITASIDTLTAALITANQEAKDAKTESDNNKKDASKNRDHGKPNDFALQFNLGSSRLPNALSVQSTIASQLGTLRATRALQQGEIDSRKTATIEQPQLAAAAAASAQVTTILLQNLGNGLH